MVRAYIFLALPVLSLAVSNGHLETRLVGLSTRVNRHGARDSMIPRRPSESSFRRASIIRPFSGSARFSDPLISRQESSIWDTRGPPIMPLRTPSHATPYRQHGLVRRADRGNILSQVPSADQTYNPMTIALAGAKARAQKPNFSPMRTHVREQTRQPQGRQIFTPLRDPPTPAPRPATRAEAAPENLQNPNQASLVRDSNQASSSRGPLTQSHDDPSNRSGTTKTTSPHSTGSQNLGSQTKTSLPGEQAESNNAATKTKGNVVTKHIGLAMDWATNHPRLACAAGAVVAAGCCSISGVGFIAYGGCAVAKGFGVGLSMTGATLGSGAGATGAIVAVGEYRKNEKITEKRMQQKFEDVLGKTIPKVPSLGKISETFKQAGEKATAAAKNNVKILRLAGGNRQPSSDSLSSFAPTEPPIPENVPATYMRSAPSELPSQRRRVSNRFGSLFFGSRPAG